MTGSLGSYNHVEGLLLNETSPNQRQRELLIPQEVDA